MWPVLVIVAVLTAATALLYGLQRIERWLEDSQKPPTKRPHRGHHGAGEE
jgi:hypothetical protein